ncbi:uncharacterized protein ASCRUDRAFT_69043 [Ascoidea rubescens DSM 1968]|uniref:Uncharacterized protein n=1 Tax=Ascoidea rubescens DSM 1968 TaxID=1344418 RepID=A0A1D2VKT3_9ASCO|nr:hypothetical protein ASCRUDRAFT_69043 [Ascoidea rubescens DSM 1968]ODV62221.1 hypothetical protein ASCRUDRAFT_69043 [Ascoidea rubescens DSM 1968]
MKEQEASQTRDKKDAKEAGDQRGLSKALFTSSHSHQLWPTQAHAGGSDNGCTRCDWLVGSITAEVISGFGGTMPTGSTTVFVPNAERPETNLRLWATLIGPLLTLNPLSSPVRFSFIDRSPLSEIIL